jgi:acetyl esterase/lipase
MNMSSPALDPEIVPLSALIPELDFSNGAGALRTLIDRVSVEMAPQLSDGIERVDHVVSEDPRVVVRVHRPKNLTAPAACLYSIHGGGYVIGNYSMDDTVFDRYCTDFGCVGVSVEYRLAPETPYPGPLEDCYQGLVWTFAHSEELSIDPTRIGIRGESAGGGLAAGLALLARDRAEVDVAFALLECPMLDDRQITPSSQCDDLRVWSRESNAFGWRSYLGDLYGTDGVPVYAAAARATDLRGLPPTFVIAGGADGFRDEDIQYATRLGQAGVPTDLAVIAGAPHGVRIFEGTAPARRWAAAVSEWLQPRLKTPR